MNNLQLLPADTPAEQQAAYLLELMKLHPELAKAALIAGSIHNNNNCALGVTLCSCRYLGLFEFMDNGCENWVKG
jgi:hypothetical protein